MDLEHNNQIDVSVNQQAFQAKLNEIDGKLYEKIIPSNISSYFSSIGEAYAKNEEDFLKIRGVNEGKLKALKNFKKHVKGQKEFFLEIHSILVKNKVINVEYNEEMNVQIDIDKTLNELHNQIYAFEQLQSKLKIKKIKKTSAGQFIKGIFWS
jgi:hypothetical protein